MLKFKKYTELYKKTNNWSKKVRLTMAIILILGFKIV